MTITTMGCVQTRADLSFVMIYVKIRDGSDIPPVTWLRYLPSHFLKVKTILTDQYGLFQHVLSIMTITTMGCVQTRADLSFVTIYVKIRDGSNIPL